MEGCATKVPNVRYPRLQAEGVFFNFRKDGRLIVHPHAAVERCLHSFALVARMELRVFSVPREGAPTAGRRFACTPQGTVAKKCGGGNNLLRKNFKWARGPAPAKTHEKSQRRKKSNSSILRLRARSAKRCHLAAVPQTTACRTVPRRRLAATNVHENTARPCLAPRGVAFRNLGVGGPCGAKMRPAGGRRDRGPATTDPNRDLKLTHIRKRTCSDHAPKLDPVEKDNAPIPTQNVGRGPRQCLIPFGSPSDPSFSQYHCETRNRSNRLMTTNWFRNFRSSTSDSVSSMNPRCAFGDAAQRAFCAIWPWLRKKRRLGPPFCWKDRAHDHETIATPALPGRQCAPYRSTSRQCPAPKRYRSGGSSVLPVQPNTRSVKTVMFCIEFFRRCQERKG